MIKNITLSSITAIALVSIIGCGGGSSSSSDVKTGTGYYVDAAVAGVDYVCGSQTGKTGADGKFTFEEGKECKFILAGVPLRTTKADELADGKKIVEENPKVAKLLQSIDADGDLSNGIQVTDEVVEALTKALEETQSKGKLPEGDTLTEVVASVGHDVEGVSGEVRTDEEVEAHLAQTKTEVTKELLAGKTFYVYFIDHDNADTPTVREIKFNDDATSFTDEIGHVIPAQINGNIVTLTYPDGGTDVMTVTTNNDKYILLYEDEEDWFKLFYSEADAKAALEAENGGDTATQTEVTKELLAGKTFYLVGRDRGVMFDKMVFNSDVSSVKMSGIDGQDKGETFTLGITVNADKMIFSDTPNKYRKIIDTKDKYLVIQEYKDGKVHGESVRLYYSESDAKAYFDSLNGGGSSSNSLSASSLKAYFSGKKLYNADDDGVTTVVFNENATTLQFGSEEPFSITILDGKIVDDEEGNHFIDEITDKYVKGHDSHGEFIFYVNRADAQAEFENNYIVSDLVSGHVDFKGYNSVPSDAWVRIVPSVNKKHGNYEGPRCKIDSNGNFGTECYIDGDKKELKDKFNKSGETFQVVVYKNHVKPEGHHWDCGEDVYKYVGGNVNFNDWQNITVTLDDYQDRSDETCDD